MICGSRCAITSLEFFATGASRTDVVKKLSGANRTAGFAGAGFATGPSDVTSMALTSGLSCTASKFRVSSPSDTGTLKATSYAAPSPTARAASTPRATVLPSARTSNTRLPPVA